MAPPRQGFVAAAWVKKDPWRADGLRSTVVFVLGVIARLVNAGAVDVGLFLDRRAVVVLLHGFLVVTVVPSGALSTVLCSDVVSSQPSTAAPRKAANAREARVGAQASWYCSCRASREAPAPVKGD